MKMRYYLVILQFLFVVALACVSSRPVPFEFAKPITAALSLWTAGLAFLITRTGLGSLSQDRPISDFVFNLKEETPTFVHAFWLALLLGFSLALQSWGKSMIPYVTTFWADPILADFDHWIFGQDPWRLFRSDFLAPAYYLVYFSWFVITFCALGLLAFSKRDQSRPLVAYFATLIFCGTFGQYILPSAGPMFYERAGFGTRFSLLLQTNDPAYTRIADWLWANYVARTPDLGAGISAMPSMHVALSVWSALALSSLWRPLALPGLIYVILIWCASIATGWHYATDGLIGTIGAVAMWKLAGAKWFAVENMRAPLIPRPALLTRKRGAV